MKQVACVTGAASGIGLAIARALAETGFRVAIVDLHDADYMEETLRSLDGDRHTYIRADISNARDRESILIGIKKYYNRLDLLVNNAGVAPKQRMDILEVSEESYDRVMEINLKGPFFLTQILANYMIELAQSGVVERPKVVNISSISAYTSSRARPEYCLSKAGIGMMTKLYADRLSEYGINVYEIRPGIIKTPMTETVQAKYDKMILEENLLPINRWGLPEDISAAVVSVTTGAFDYSTGQVFNVDGGFHLRRL